MEGAGEVDKAAAGPQDALGAVAARESGLARRNRELAALIDATRAIASSLDLEEILRAIVNQAASISGTPIVRLFLLDEEAHVLRYRVGMGLPLEVEQGLAIPVGESFSGQVAATGRPLAVADCREDPRLRYPEHATKYSLISYLGLPVKLGDRVLGVLVFNTKAPRGYSDEEITYLSAFADHAAIAIENARLHDTAVWRAQQLRTLNEMTRFLTTALDPQAVAREILAAVQVLIPGAAGRLWGQVREEGALRLIDSIGHRDPEGGRVLRLRPGEGLAGIAAASLQPITSQDVTRDPRFLNRAWAVAEGLVSCIVLPLVYGERANGVLAISTRTPHTFTDDEVGFLRSFAAQAAIAIENAHLYEAARREIDERKRAEKLLAGRSRQLEAVRLTSEEITRELDLTRLLDLIIKKAAELVGAASGFVSLWEEEDQVLAPRAWHGLGEWVTGMRSRLGEGVTGTVAARREGMIVNTYRASPLALPDVLEHSQISAVMSEPLLHRDRLVGVVTLSNEGSSKLFTEEDQYILRLFATQAAIAIENARLYEAARQELAERTQAEAALVERTRQIEAIRTVSTEITRELDLSKLLGLITQRAVDLLGSGEGMIRLWDERAQALVPMAWTAGGHRGNLRLDEGVAGTVARRREGLIVNDFRASPYATPDILQTTTHTAVLAEPLLYRDRLVGVVVVNRRPPLRLFTEEDREIIALFATQGAIAIENARLFKEERVRREQLEAIRAVADEITRELDLTVLLQLISRRAAELAHVSSSTVWLWDEANQILTPGAWHGYGAWMRDRRLRLGEGVSGAVAERREGLLVNDYRSSPYRLTAVLEQSKTTAMLAEPLLYRDKLLGVIRIAAEAGEREFTTEDQHLLRLFAAQAAIAIENARLHEAAVRRGEELQAMLRAARTVMSGLDLRGTLDRIIREAAQISGIPHVKVALVDKEERVVRVAAAVGRPAAMLEGFAVALGMGTSGLVAATGQPLFIADCVNDPRNHLFADQDRELGIRTYLGLPIKIRDEVLGVLTFNTKEPHQYSAGELTYLASFADQAAIAIENARLYGEIQQHAATLEARVKERTAELEEALRVKVEFLGKMSHELRTPLNFVLGFSDLLQQGMGGSLTPKQTIYLDRIQSGGRRLLSLVNDVLDIAQVDAGKSRLNLEPVILGPLIQEVLGLVQVQATQKSLKVMTALDPWLPFIVADRFKLAQILHNLIGNAVKFTPDGGSIRVTARQVPGSESTGAGEHGSRGESAPQPPGATAPQQFIEIGVEDTGIGIHPENLGSIFEAFYQVDSSETRAHGGAGLGLALVRKLVELHGGRVWAESAGPGQGARFVVRLPRLEVPKAKKVLLAEDDALVRIPMASALEGAGFVVGQAATGAEALAAMEAGAPDLLILDILLPDLDGWEILRRVRAAEDIRTLPVLVVTGLESVNAEQALALGADEFLTKPISPRVLVDTVVRLLAHFAGEGSAAGQRTEGAEEERDRGIKG